MYAEFLPIVKRGLIRYFHRMAKQAEQTLSEVVVDRLKALNTNAFAVENAAGLPQDAVRSILRGGKKSGTTLNRAKEVCDALGLEFYIGPKRQMQGFAEDRPVTDFGERDASRAGFRLIPWHPVARQGGGVPIAFSQNWFDDQGLNPDFLQAIVPDESHLPFTLEKNTVALLQTNAPRKGSGAIWCYRDGFSVGIARVGFVHGAAVVTPRDEASETLIIPREAVPGMGLLGKVVWLGFTTA